MLGVLDRPDGIWVWNRGTASVRWSSDIALAMSKVNFWMVSNVWSKGRSNPACKEIKDCWCWGLCFSPMDRFETSRSQTFVFVFAVAQTWNSMKQHHVLTYKSNIYLRPTNSKALPSKSQVRDAATVHTYMLGTLEKLTWHSVNTVCQDAPSAKGHPDKQSMVVSKRKDFHESSNWWM